MYLFSVQMTETLVVSNQLSSHGHIILSLGIRSHCMRARNKFGQLILKYVQSEKNVKGLMQQEEIKNL